MPPVFGGAPTCPTCSQKVYFAEQTLGPGGRAFHKRCLKCVECGKLLEPRLLVDHDGEAYCKNCHSKSWGTKGYGAGGALVGEYQPRSSPTRTISTSATNSPVNSPVRPSASFSQPPPPPARPAIPPKPSFTTSTSQPPVESSHLSSHPPAASSSSRPSFDSQPSSSYRPLPIPPTRTTPSVAASSTSTAPRSTPSFSDDEDESTTTTRRLRAFPPSQFAPKSSMGSGDLCRRCGTQVYFAEKLIAVGSTWHKRCLRCASCSTTLNSHLLERDRLPYCKKCYQEQFGTGSLGITSVRSLLLLLEMRTTDNLFCLPFCDSA
ncbi:LIM domain-containing protein [Sporobolomyces salmoneus]|uniref:LIM domain-containing protein n=1 Tax=Sporobolomyces salmoneus TaxID=183962 RepID=UPI003177660C